MSEYESFEWDKHNIEKNEKRHGIFFKESEEVFIDDPVFYEDIKHSITEKRFQCIGVTKKNRLLFISFTIREQNIRIISARSASRKERKQYEKTKKNS
jgi:uncharacterized DUF497 family protein